MPDRCAHDGRICQVDEASPVNRLDRYIFRQGAIPFVLILLCTTAVIWLTQVLQRVDLMVEDGGSLASFLQVTVLLIPSLVGVIVPFALLASVLYALNLLAMDNELSVMGAAGASRTRIGRPIMVLSLIAGMLVLVINVDLQPRSYRTLKETVEFVRSDVARALIQSGVFTKVSPGVTVYAEEARPGDQYIGLLIQDERDPAKPVTYTAEKGLFKVTVDGPRLLLRQGTVQRINPESGEVDILRFIETAVDLASFKEPPGRRRLEGTERYVSELLRPNMDDPYDADRAGRFIAEGHARLATPLYPVAFGMMALAAMLTAPMSRRGYSQRLMMVVAGAILLRTLGYITQNAATAGPVANVLQYLLPTLTILACGVLIAGTFWRAKRRPPPPLSAVLDDPTRVTRAL